MSFSRSCKVLLNSQSVAQYVPELGGSVTAGGDGIAGGVTATGEGGELVAQPVAIHTQSMSSSTITRILNSVCILDFLHLVGHGLFDLAVALGGLAGSSFPCGFERGGVALKFGDTVLCAHEGEGESGDGQQQRDNGATEHLGAKVKQADHSSSAAAYTSKPPQAVATRSARSTP